MSNKKFFKSWKVADPIGKLAPDKSFNACIALSPIDPGDLDKGACCVTSYAFPLRSEWDLLELEWADDINAGDAGTVSGWRSKNTLHDNTVSFHLDNKTLRCKIENTTLPVAKSGGSFSGNDTGN